MKNRQFRDPANIWHNTSNENKAKKPTTQKLKRRTPKKSKVNSVFAKDK